MDNKYGYINQQGEEVIKPQFDDVGGFTANGLLRVKVDGRYGYIKAPQKASVGLAVIEIASLRDASSMVIHGK
jgi:hypothetical protein